MSDTELVAPCRKTASPPSIQAVGIMVSKFFSIAIHALKALKSSHFINVSLVYDE